MKISIIGTGYVGLVTGVGLASKGHEVICVDIDSSKVNMINQGVPPIYEEGLEEMLEEVVGDGKLRATEDTDEAVLSTEVTFICVGTPSKDTGEFDLSYVKSAAEDVSNALKEKETYHVVCVKSTVLPGTTDSVVLPILERSGKKVGEDIGLAMNPEFLREGKALPDFLEPDRIVIGGIDEKSSATIEEIYSGFDAPKLVTNLRTAEMIKYTSNALLATKISFANEISRLCEKIGVDVYDVMDGAGMDHRIERRFLNAGAGFGGSCFPKDVKALLGLAEKEGLGANLLRSVLGVNETQPIHVVDLLEEELSGLGDKTIALLGLTFKGDTDDVRESRALPIAEELMKRGALVRAYDPEGKENFSKLIDGITYADSVEDALRDADGCIIQNDWEEFKELNQRSFSEMKNKVIVDGRRILDADAFSDDIIYIGVGRGKNTK
ncbi:MAG: UDP-glucose/GDP-mannose dehydrogenase family protein [Thermoplasmata archaeon]